MLEDMGLDVLQASSATEALMKLAEKEVDVLMTDIGLPGMDGLALTRLIKADESLRHIPVLALTAFAMKGDDAKAREAGCDGYITKPIDTRTLPSLIALALQRPNRAGES